MDLLAYWNLTHHAPSGSSAGEDYVPTLEDLRLLLTRPVTPGDLAWLYGKIKPRDPKKEMARIYVEPEARGEDLNERIAALFVHYPEGEA